jgi:hypothetical protein
LLDFKGFIDEAFQKPYKFKVNRLRDSQTLRDNKGNIAVQNSSFYFETEGRDYVRVDVPFFETNKETGDGYLLLSFSREGSFDLGGGDPFRIFATIIAIAQEAKEQMEDLGYYVYELKFYAESEEANRVKAYDRIMKRYARQMGYKHEVKDLGPQTMFRMYTKPRRKPRPGVKVHLPDDLDQRINRSLRDSGYDLPEENVPNNPELWDKSKAKAKRKFDKWPSAYASAYAAKEYKKAGGTWKKTK